MAHLWKSSCLNVVLAAGTVKQRLKLSLIGGNVANYSVQIHVKKQTNNEIV